MARAAASAADGRPSLNVTPWRRSWTICAPIARGSSAIPIGPERWSWPTSSAARTSNVIPLHGRSPRRYSTPHSKTTMHGCKRSRFQILRLKITVNGETAAIARIRSARFSSVRRRAQRHSG